jgi:hypothetical protein
MPTHKMLVVSLSFILVGLGLATSSQAAEQPRRGGHLEVALAGDPPGAQDHEANLREAKRLLAEAGCPHSFQTVLTKRHVKLPSVDFTTCPRPSSESPLGGAGLVC